MEDLRERTIWKTLRRGNVIISTDLTRDGRAWTRLIWLRIMQVASCWPQGKEISGSMKCGVLTS